MNQAMKDVFGSNREGELCYQAFRDGGAPCDHCPIPRLLGTDGDAEDKSAWECYNPLSKRWYSNFDRLMLWPDGRQVKVQIAFDISDRKQWELEREAAEKALHDNQKTEALQRMAGAISHHFNNQLTVIIGNLQLALEAGNDETQVREYLQSAIQVAIDSSEISMLLSQYTGQPSAELQPIDVGEFCRRQRPLLEKLLPANILLETDGLATGLCIHGDTVTLEQILTQLVTNSRDAINGRGGRIGIFVTLIAGKDIAYQQCEPKNWRPSVSSYCCLSVKDSGVWYFRGQQREDFRSLFHHKTQQQRTRPGRGPGDCQGLRRSGGGNQ
jgi:signal transduction histidine kinase